MAKKYILAMDVGTTSIRTLAFDVNTQTFFNITQQDITSYYPEPSWVEQNPNQIMDVINSGLRKTLENIKEDEIFGVGLTNQRESVVAWEKDSGKPLYNAIIWQCRRTHKYCAKLNANAKIRKFIQKRTGLFPDSYFSATKIKWLIDNVPEVKQALKDNNLCVGTLDSFIIYSLSKGKYFVTDHTNASRTLLYNLKTQNWDPSLLKFFDIPLNILPQIINCDQPIGEITIDSKKINIGGILGDQQASLLGQCCTHNGDTKITYGTGAFMLINIGSKLALPKRLITTIAWKTKEGVNFAYEGNIYSAGACITWIKDKLKLIHNPAESEILAKSVEDTNGVMFVPALAGLGAPFWKSDVKAQFVGLTLATQDAHIVRAVLYSIAYSTRAVFDEAKKYSNFSKINLKADGGMTVNATFMQFVSTILNNPVIVSAESESTSLGACYICGLTFGAYNSIADLRKLYKVKKLFNPDDTNTEQEEQYKDWLKYIEKM